MTLSFVAKEKDCIDCKLYWNGAMSTFKPKDLKFILPKIFNMKWNGFSSGNESTNYNVNNENNENIVNEPDEDEKEKINEQEKESKKETREDKSTNEKFLDGDLGEYAKQDEYQTIDQLIEIMDKQVKNKPFDNFYQNLLK